MSVSCGGINSKPIRERINYNNYKATLIIINSIITKRLIIVTDSIGWEPLTTNLNANNEVYSFFALKGKCRL